MGHKAVNMEEAENKENKVMTIANVSKESRRPLDWQMTKQNLSERGQYLLETGFRQIVPLLLAYLQVKEILGFFGVTKCF